MDASNDPLEIDPLVADLFADLAGDGGLCFYNHVVIGPDDVLCAAGPYLSQEQAHQRLATFFHEFPGATHIYTATAVDLPGWSEEKQFYLISKSQTDYTRVACGPFRSHEAAKAFEDVARRYWSRAVEFPDGDVYHCTHGQVYPQRWIRSQRPVRT
jgi:hypothetical protein